MRVKQTSEKLILQDSPGCFWLFGSFFVFVGAIFCYGSLGGFTNSTEVDWWVLPLTFLMSMAAISVGFWIIFSHPLITTTLDRQTQTVIVKRTHIFGKTVSDFRLADVSRFELAEGKDSDGDPVWRVEIILQNGSRVPLAADWTRGIEEAKTAIAAANDFAAKQLN